MFTIKLLFFSLAFIFANLITQSQSCECVDRPPQDHYCESAFTGQIFVKGQREVEDPDQNVYIVNVEHIFRTNDTARRVLQGGQLYTMKSSASCGVHLEANQRYIVTGYVDDGKAEIVDCGFHQVTSQVSQHVKLEFEGEYKPQCKSFCILHIIIFII